MVKMVTIVWIVVIVIMVLLNKKIRRLEIKKISL